MYRPPGPDRIPTVIEADLFFHNGPRTVKLKPPPTCYLHPSPDWCICSLPLVAFVLLSPQEKPLNILSRALSLFLLLKKKQKCSSFAPWLHVVLSDFAVSVGRERAGGRSLMLPFAGDNGLLRSSPAAITPLLISWFLSSCVSQCTFALQQGWWNRNYILPSTGCKTKLQVGCSWWWLVF